MRLLRAFAWTIANAGHFFNVHCMSITMDQMVEEIRALPHDVKAELLDRVLVDDHGGQSPDHARAWSETVHRRIAEIEQGTAPVIPLDEALAQARQRLRR
jgi:predicted anti-sigma-YlaC factor YlaD